MKKTRSRKENKPPQLLEKWPGGHQRGRLDSPVSNKLPVKPEKKKRN